MSDALALDSSTNTAFAGATNERSLGGAAKGDRGVIVRVTGETGAAEAVETQELERRLLEFGFVEGARIEVLHEGAVGRDPVAVKLDDMRVGLRRREAHGVKFVRSLDPSVAS
jgi:ferrous iron transport protein A